MCGQEPSFSSLCDLPRPWLDHHEEGGARFFADLGFRKLWMTTYYYLLVTIR